MLLSGGEDQCHGSGYLLAQVGCKLGNKNTPKHNTGWRVIRKGTSEHRHARGNHQARVNRAQHRPHTKAKRQAGSLRLVPQEKARHAHARDERKKGRLRAPCVTTRDTYKQARQDRTGQDTHHSRQRRQGSKTSLMYLLNFDSGRAWTQFNRKRSTANGLVGHRGGG